ncbi:SAM-dependent methyltransferase, partial [Candidatus Termititenax persephonae]
MPDKRRIGSLFSRAAGDYDRQASWQKQIAARLFACLTENPSS